MNTGCEKHIWPEPRDGWCPVCLLEEREALDMTRRRLLDERNQALKERDALRREAESHAQEARTQRATVQEIYQLVTGSTGEPGDWHGAEPVRALIEERDALATEAADWEEVAYRFQADCNALAAHMERLIRGGRYLHHELQQWSLTERDPETSAASASSRKPSSSPPAAGQPRRSTRCGARRR